MKDNNIFEYRNCLLCSGSGYKIIYEGNTNVVKCSNCGLRYANPGIREDANKDIIVLQEDRDIKRYNALRNYQLPRFNKELELIEKLIKPGRILDIGCGNGNFLECAKSRGWETYGVDINPASFEPCSQHGKIFTGSLHDAQYKINFFDVVFSSSTFYYIIKPIAFLEEVKRVLKPGGLSVISGIPNIKSLDAFIKFESLIKPYPPEQVSYYFRKKDLKEIVRRAGLEIVNLESRGFGISLSKFPEKSGNNSNKKDYSTEIPKISKAASKGIIKSLVKPAVNSLLNLFNLGYQFTMYCRKPL